MELARPFSLAPPLYRYIKYNYKQKVKLRIYLFSLKGNRIPEHHEVKRLLPRRRAPVIHRSTTVKMKMF